MLILLYSLREDVKFLMQMYSYDVVLKYTLIVGLQIPKG